MIWYRCCRRQLSVAKMSGQVVLRSSRRQPPQQHLVNPAAALPCSPPCAYCAKRLAFSRTQRLCLLLTKLSWFQGCLGVKQDAGDWPCPARRSGVPEKDQTNRCLDLAGRGRVWIPSSSRMCRRLRFETNSENSGRAPGRPTAGPRQAHGRPTAGPLAGPH